MWAETPAIVIQAAIDAFVFASFVRDAIFEGRITPTTFRGQIKLDAGGYGLNIQKAFSPDDLVAGAGNVVLMALGTTAIATDKAMDIVFGGKRPDETTDLGSARAIIYQVRCAYAHDPLNPVWKPKLTKYNKKYCVTVEVPKQSDGTVSRQIEFDPDKLNEKPVEFEHLGGLGGYMSLLHYCLKKVKEHPRGNEKYTPPDET